MQKSVRLFVLIAVMTIVATPSMQAEQWGTNPHPQVTKVAPSGWAAFVSSFRSYFGM